MNYPEDILNCNNYVIELEQNTLKKRAGIYIRKDVRYIRRSDLEKVNCHIVIIDVTACTNFRLISNLRDMPYELVGEAA